MFLLWRFTTHACSLNRPLSLPPFTISLFLSSSLPFYFFFYRVVEAEDDTLSSSEPHRLFTLESRPEHQPWHAALQIPTLLRRARPPHLLSSL